MLGCFHLLVIVNGATVNTRVHVFPQVAIFVLLGIYLEVELLDHMVILCLTF